MNKKAKQEKVIEVRHPLAVFLEARRFDPKNPKRRLAIIAQECGLPYLDLSLMIQHWTPITTQMAEGFARVSNQPARWWLKLQDQHNKWKTLEDEFNSSERHPKENKTPKHTP